MNEQPPLRRILMTTDAVGGVWHYALELCHGFAERGIEVVLACMGPRPSAGQRAAASALANVTLRESDFRLEWMPEPWADVARAGEWLLELEERNAPDLVHLNGFAQGALSWRAPALVVAHSCVLSWWRAVHGTEAPPAWNCYRDRVREGLLGADLVVAPSRTMLASLVRNYGALPRSRVIPNGREPSDYDARKKQPVVLGVGRLWDEAKNAATLAVAARSVAWPVVLVGDASPPEGVGASPRLENVALPGPQTPEQLRRLLADAAVFAAPALYEPFGLAVLEAALSGCALVLGDIASLRENWDGAAEFVSSRDPQELARRLNALARDPRRRALLARRAQARGRLFTRERMVELYLDAAQSCRRANPAVQREEIFA